MVIGCAPTVDALSGERARHDDQARRASAARTHRLAAAAAAAAAVGRGAGASATSAAFLYGENFICFFGPARATQDRRAAAEHAPARRAPTATTAPAAASPARTPNAPPDES